MTDAQNAPNNQNNQPVFSIEKVYVKDLSLEVPNAPQVFLERNVRWIGESMDLQLLTDVEEILRPIQNKTWTSGRSESN